MTDNAEEQRTTGLFALVAEREVEGLLLPWGELSAVSVDGHPPVRFARGTVTIPRDPSVVSLNVEHDRYSPIGRAVQLRDEPAGIVARFAIANTEEGDAYLASRDRRKLSPELGGIVTRGMDGVRAKLAAAAAVTAGAFATAGLFARGPIEDEAQADEAQADEAQADEAQADEAQADEAQPDEAQPDEAQPDEAQPDEAHGDCTPDEETTGDAPASTDNEPHTAAAHPTEEDTMATATASGFAAAQPTTDAPAGATTNVGLFALAHAIVAARRSGNDQPLQAIVRQAEQQGLFALADQKYDAAAGDLGKTYVPQYLTDIWEGDYDALAYSTYFDSGELTDLTFRQRTITQRPLVDKWTGNKTEIPSRAAKVTTTDKSAQRFAGGLDVGREHYDFGKVEDVALLLQLMGESYRENSEAYIRDELLAAATPLALDAAAKPAGVSDAHWKLVRGAVAVLRSGKALPTVAFVASDLFDELLFAGKDSGLEYLQTSLGLTGGTLDNFAIVPDDDLDAGSVLVGARKAAQVLTLPGSPIRVNALDVARGGVDEALFGYVGVRTRRATGLQLVTTAPGA